jgi:hypothetical protein
MEVGYWPNETNMELFSSEVLRLLDWLEPMNLLPDAIVYDLEPAFDYGAELRETFRGIESLPALEALLRSHLGQAAYERAREILEANVRAVQARGLTAICVTFPQVIDDGLDADDDLQDALDIPVRGVSFDEVGFMVYQPGFAEAIGEWIGPGLIAAYGKDAKEQFGDRATIALGTVGSVGIIATRFSYDEPAVLGADIAAALAEGIERVEIYSLDGMVATLGAETWLRGTRVLARAGGASIATELVRSLTQGIDMSLSAPPADGGRGLDAGSEVGP